MKNWGLYTWLGVDVLSSVSMVAMNDGVVPIAFGTTANDGIVSRVLAKGLCEQPDGCHPCFSLRI